MKEMSELGAGKGEEMKKGRRNGMANERKGIGGGKGGLEGLMERGGKRRRRRGGRGGG